MKAYPISITMNVRAPLNIVWNALVIPEKMKLWYFDIPGFKAEKDFEFSFKGGTKKREYIHLCKITEVIEQEKISYTWKYKGIEGISQVSFELKQEGEVTIITLTHTGLETFPADNPDLKWNNFYEGWSYILKTSLKNYIESV